ncbi:unnamed protein product, partial [Polarella glacialis]
PTPTMPQASQVRVGDPGGDADFSLAVTRLDRFFSEEGDVLGRALQVAAQHRTVGQGFSPAAYFSSSPQQGLERQERKGGQQCRKDEPELRAGRHNASPSPEPKAPQAPQAPAEDSDGELSDLVEVFIGGVNSKRIPNPTQSLESRSGFSHDFHGLNDMSPNSSSTLQSRSSAVAARAQGGPASALASAVAAGTAAAPKGYGTLGGYGTSSSSSAGSPGTQDHLSQRLKYQQALHDPYVKALSAHRKEISDASIDLASEGYVVDSLASRLSTQRYGALAELDLPGGYSARPSWEDRGPSERVLRTGASDGDVEGTGRSAWANWGSAAPAPSPRPLFSSFACGDHFCTGPAETSGRNRMEDLLVVYTAFSKEDSEPGSSSRSTTATAAVAGSPSLTSEADIKRLVEASSYKQQDGLPDFLSVLLGIPSHQRFEAERIVHHRFNNDEEEEQEEEDGNIVTSVL